MPGNNTSVFTQFVIQNRRRRWWKKLVQVMACVVVFCTTYALILPAITMEKDAQCGYAEHTHDSSCYTKQVAEPTTQSICTYEVLDVHEHTDDCKDVDDAYICGYADFIVHEHDSMCFDSAGTLICQLPEVKAHSHEAGCYADVETVMPHTHDDSCYTMQRGGLTCEQPEEEGHSHGNDCYTQGELVCQTAETEGHTHGEGCSTTELVCTLEFVAHAHGDGCYEQLVCELPEDESHTHGEECSGQVLVCTATEDPHDHTGSCYQTTYTCGQGEYPAHSHCRDCYNWTLTCSLDETEGHQHGDTCYEQIETLTCELEEITEPAEAPEPELICTEDVVELHTHEDNCWEVYTDEQGTEYRTLICGRVEILEHIHSGECVETITPDTDVLTCGLTETEGHTHSAEAGCCDESGAPICQTAEEQPHAHSDMCYGTWELTCGETEHTHTDACYPVTYYCGSEEHIHGEGCFDAEGTLTCEITEHAHSEACTVEPEAISYYCGSDEHTHGEGCFDAEGTLTCQLPEHTHSEECTVDPNAVTYYCGIEEHTHNEECSDAEGNLICTLTEHTHTEECQVEPPVYYCGFDEHTHNEECSDAEGNLICGREEHIHTESCLVESVYLCGLEEHSHAETCWDENGELICGLKEHTHFILCTDPNARIFCWLTEHTHEETCWDENGVLICDAYEHTHIAECCDHIGSLVVMIDMLPTSEEAEEILLAYEEAEDWDGYAAYQQKVSDLAWRLYYACEELDEDELLLVTNYDRLMDLSWLWSASTFEADISGVTYNPDYEEDAYHIPWTTPGTWITQSTDPRVHINEVVPDEYTIDGLVLGAKSADSVSFSRPDLVVINSVLTDDAATAATGFDWATLTGSGFDCTYGANLVLPSDADAKAALLSSEPIYTLYKNIGTYDGEIIDLKISLVDYENYVNWNPNITDETKRVEEGVLGFWTFDTRSGQATYGQSLPGISVCGVSWVRVLYEFLDSNGNEIDVKGSTSFYDLDFAQAVHIRAGDTKLKGIYVTDVNSSVPNLDTVNSYGTRAEQRSYFENWTVDDCVLKFSNDAPKDWAGVVIYSSHGNDSGQNSEQYGDTKHAFTFTFERNNINIVYSFDKGKNALSGSSTADKLAYTRNANGGIIHSGVPVYTGSLEIQKEVTGIVDTEREFRFQVEFYKSGTTIDDTLDGKFGDVTIVDGVGTFALKHGESVKISGIPIRANGTLYKITELTTEGYIVETSMTQQAKNSTLESYGSYTQSYYSNTLQADDVMAQHQIVVFENYGGPVLPQTGGAGTTTYTMVGLVLTIVSAAYLLYRSKARRREAM